MILTARQLEALRQLIVDHHTAFVANMVNPAQLSEETISRLARLGLVRPQAKGVADAYALGVLASKAPDAGDSITFRQLRSALASQSIPLSSAEKAAIQAAEMSAGQYITGLGNRVAGQIAARVLDAVPGPTQAETYVGQVRDVVANAVRDRKTLKQIKSDLGWSTGDWTRDLERVANTELSHAMSVGTAQKAVRDFGPAVRVAKLHAPRCCKHCKRLYCVDKSDIPRVFLLTELEGNGTNVGRRASEWLPTLGPLHPHCRCVVQAIPPGMIFNAKGQMVASGAGVPKKSPK